MRRLRVFLCYATGDKPAVRRLYRWLLDEGFQPWLDEEELLPGQRWREEISKAVLTADVVLVCLSHHAINKAGYMQREMRMALDIAEEQPESTIYLVPLRLEPCELPERISHFHAVDLFDERGWARLLRVLVIRCNELGLSPPSSFAPPAALEATRNPAISSASSVERSSPIILPDLLQQRHIQRIARGVAYRVIAAGDRHILVLSRGGALFVDLETMQIVWEIDCPNQCGTYHAGRGLLVLGSRQHIHLWDMKQRMYLDTLRAHTGRVSTLSLSPDGTSLASGSHDETVRLWRFVDELVVITLQGHTGPIRSSAFSPDGKMLATGADNGTIRLWYGQEGSHALLDGSHVLLGRSPIRCLAFSPDGTMLAGGNEQGIIRLWSPRSGERIDFWRGHQAAVREIAFSPDGALLASASDDGHVRVWRVMDGANIHTLKGTGTGWHSVSFIPPPLHSPSPTPPSPRFLVAVSDHQQQAVQMWSFASLATTPSSSSTPIRRAVKNAKTVKPTETSSTAVEICAGYMTAVTAMALSPDGAWLASASGDQRITLWHLPEGVPVHHLEGHTGTIRCMLFSPDGRWLASGADDRTVSIWSVDQKRQLYQFTHHDWVRGLAFSPDSKALAVASHDVWLWNIAHGTPSHLRKRHPEHVTSVAFSPDGETIASVSWSGTVRLWHITSGERIRTLRSRAETREDLPGTSLLIAFIPDPQTLAIVSSNRVLRLWHIGQRVTTRVLKGYKGKLLSAAFAPDGKTIAAASGDGVVRLWSMSNGELLRSLCGHTTAVQGVSFTADGATVVSASEDGTIRFWALW